MRPDRAAAFYCAALALATPGGAIPLARPAAPVSPQDEVRSAVRGAVMRAGGGDCEGALGLLDPVLPRVVVPEERRIVQRIRVTCLGQLGRVAEAKSAYDELAAADPNNATVRTLGVMIAADSGDITLAGERLATFAEEQPAGLDFLTGDAWRGISTRLVQAGKVDLRRRVSLALARGGWQPPDNPELAQAVASDAIEALVAQRELPEARSLLARIRAPEVLFSMAVERVYQPLWPEVEAAMGPASGTAIDAFAAEKIESNARNPNDPQALRDAVRAYLLLGRPADAVALAAPIKVRPGMSEDEIAVVRDHAQALAAERKPMEAIARLKELATLDFSTAPEAASGAILLAELYHDNNRPADELAVAREMLARKDDVFSPWGRAWLRRSEVCGLADLRRVDEAKVAGDALLADAAANQPAAIEAMLCAGRDTDAAKLTIETLSTAEGASRLADQFQPADALWSSPSSRLRTLWQTFLTRADVKAAFEKGARVLPRALWPGKAPREIPRLPATAPSADTV